LHKADIRKPSFHVGYGLGSGGMMGGNWGWGMGMGGFGGIGLLVIVLFIVAFAFLAVRRRNS